jgi:hypothetical protein
VKKGFIVAMCVVGKPRGFLRISAKMQRSSLLFTLSIQDEWREAHDFAVHGCKHVVRAAASDPQLTVKAAVARLLKAAPLKSVVTMVQVCPPLE